MSSPPFSAALPLPTPEFESVRTRMMFDFCKWDVQSEDHCVIADFPLLLDRSAWNEISLASETMSQELLSAERELLMKTPLHSQLGLPSAIHSVLSSASPQGISPARVMRFDFHFTSEGWRISEVNADVPGGFIEAGALPQLMSQQYPNCSAPPNPGESCVGEICSFIAGHDVVALVHATAHSDDRQVMEYLADLFRRRGIRAIPISPNHLAWDSGTARIVSAFANETPYCLVRFFPAEWLPNLHPSVWEPWFIGGRTPMSNPAAAILLQSKRFPLVASQLTAALPAWRKLLPESKSPDEITLRSGDWVLKPALGRVGEDVAIREVTPLAEYEQILKACERNPSGWIAQRRFDSLPIETQYGRAYVCLGVFTVNGRASGIYGRIAAKPLIDHAAQDIAVLIRDSQAGAS